MLVRLGSAAEDESTREARAGGSHVASECRLQQRRLACRRRGRRPSSLMTRLGDYLRVALSTFPTTLGVAVTRLLERLNQEHAAG
ncbi:hypothetical protein THICB1_100368 [Thiomonas arsenitoxydans]|uniref:Uncharacterized protein n=1 Tax=Thiomonas arsenitoxydans (strain DSM 22701 / CIP 110005 / 3As) TaxID=426114 RepID=A0ABM9T132_THIA3|nr:hypothetical protein THICB1_100368 [Thiomonas arsenitoxydans]CQR30244.1 hypothetical protein ACO3_220060 [Thiomonas arsenitoxydans]CQR30296.1 hypothetical protein ACO7_200059 [Thiomonas arsenitoxydans]CQR32321.1 hypothetical protein THICB6_160167 [Thiomonas arsenitoxydans]